MKLSKIPRSIILTKPGYYLLSWFDDKIIVSKGTDINNSAQLSGMDFIHLDDYDPTILIGNNMNDLWMVDSSMNREDWEDFRKCHNLSQNQIDAIQKELDEAQLILTYAPKQTEYFSIDPKSYSDFITNCGTHQRIGYRSFEDDSDRDTHDNEHQHSWELYTGLIETFEHCKECGQKK